MTSENVAVHWICLGLGPTLSNSQFKASLHILTPFSRNPTQGRAEGGLGLELNYSSQDALRDALASPPLCSLSESSIGSSREEPMQLFSGVPVGGCLLPADVSFRKGSE